MSSNIIITKHINQISPDDRNFILIGVVIAKSEPKFFIQSGGSRGVVTLTIRDSERDTINCTIWGTQLVIDSYDSLFHIGDVVSITKPKVLPVSNEQFSPRCTCTYSLMLNEQDSCSIKLYEGACVQQLKKLAAVPSINPKNTYPLADIAAGGQSANGQYVNILAAVRSVRPRKQVIVAKTGQLKYYREVILMDVSHPGMSMKFWSNEYVERIDTWIPMTTVLLVMDAKIEFSQYFKTVCITMSGKTIVTEDPAVEATDQLLVQIMKMPQQETDIMGSVITGTTDLTVITSVMTVQQIIDRAEGDLKNEEDQFTAVCYAVITKFDLDGCSRITSRKCLNCKSLLRSTDQNCPREQCVHNPFNISTYFDIPINITDHTGTLINCRLMNQAAENTLKCSVERFLKMGDIQKGKLKWRFLLERCAMKLVIKRKSPIRFQTIYSIVECSLASIKEVESKIKVY